MPLQRLARCWCLLLLLPALPAQGPLEFAELWLVQLRSRDLALRQRAYDLLRQVGPVLLPRLIELLAEPEVGGALSEYWAPGGWDRPTLGPEASIEERLQQEFDHWVVAAQDGLFERAEWIESAADLGSGRQPKEAIAALVGQLGAAAQPAVPVLLQLLATADQGLAACCFWALLRPGLDVLPQVPELIERAHAAEQKREVVRLLHLLGRLSGRDPARAAAAVAPLLASNPPELTAAETELVRLGAPAVAPLQERLPAAQGGELLAIQVVLGHLLAGEPLAALLARGLDSSDAAVRGHAVATLFAARGALPPAAAAALTARFLEQLKPGGAGPAELLALGALGRQAAGQVAVVIAGLDAADAETRRGALLAVARLGPVAQAALPALLHLLRDPPAWYEFGALILGALAKVAPPEASAAELGAALLAAWQRIPVDPTEPLRPAAAQGVVRTLGRVPVPGPVAQQILAEAEASGDWRLRALACGARWRIEPDRRGALLADLVHDLAAPVSSDRRVAALALGDLGSAGVAALPALEAALTRETHGETRIVMTSALAAVRSGQ